MITTIRLRCDCDSTDVRLPCDCNSTARRYEGRKVHTFDIAQSNCSRMKRSGMARVLGGFHSFTCTSTRSSAIGMSHTCFLFFE